MNGLLVVLAAAATLPGATIFTSAGFGGCCLVSADCSGGGPGSSHAGCSGQTFDRGRLWSNDVQADVFTTATLAGASESYSLYQPYGPLALAEASYQNDFAITIFGGSGFGLFMPCFSVSGRRGAARAIATLREPPVFIPPIGGGGQSSFGIDVAGSIGAANSCILNPVPNPGGGFSFAFGEPVSFGIALDALAGSFSDGRSEADFLFSFNVSQVVLDGSGHVTGIQSLPTATWNLVDLSVPEPSTVVPMALFLAIMLVSTGTARKKWGKLFDRG
jgi:hypothetical protein